VIPQEIIRRKRDGGVLEEAQIAFFIAGVTLDSHLRGGVHCLLPLWGKQRG
jgi:thymidine phosphorylase